MTVQSLRLRPGVVLDETYLAATGYAVDADKVRWWLGRAQAGTVLAPGAIDAGRRSVNVGTGRGVLELLRVQPAGKRPMAAADWGRGLGGQPGGFE